MPAPGALARRPGRFIWSTSRRPDGLAAEPLSPSDKLRQRHLKRRREFDEIPIARVPQPALDLADVGPVHPGKIGQPLLREAVDFATPRPNRIAKSL